MDRKLTSTARRQFINITAARTDGLGSHQPPDPPREGREKLGSNALRGLRWLALGMFREMEMSHWESRAEAELLSLPE